jgi:hypothetical protein
MAVRTGIGGFLERDFGGVSPHIGVESLRFGSAKEQIKGIDYG